MGELPNVLYKYRGSAQFYRDLRLLVDRGRLWLAPARDLNDPFECAPPIVLPGLDTVDQAAKDYCDATAIFSVKDPTKIAAHIRRLHSDADERRSHARLEYRVWFRTVRVCSLSAPSRDPILWAHYGGNFSGFAVGYETAKLRHSKPVALLAKVDYLPDRPAFEPFGTTTNWYPVVTTKAVEWRYEQEARLVGFQSRGRGMEVRVPRGAIKRIYLGPRIDSAHRRDLLHSVRGMSPRPEVYQLHVNPEVYRLDEAQIL